MAIFYCVAFALILANQVFTVNASHDCGCTDCICSRYASQTTVLGINLWILIGLLPLIGFIVVFTIFYFFCERNKRELRHTAKSALQTGTPLSKLDKGRIRYREEKFKLFKSVAHYSADYPFLVIIIAALILLFLSHWLKEVRIYTDPVDLWTPPNSEVLKQKEYFVSSFGPLPRKTNVIVSYHKRPLSPGEDGSPATGYVLSKDVLSRVLTLQGKIENIKVWDATNSKYVTLSDICVTPLGSDSKDKQCEVTSVLNYWQNQKERLDKKATGEDGKTVNYKDHLQACISNPSLWDDGTALQLPCTGPLGETVLPDKVIGGYEDDNYEEATALFITIPLVEYKSERDPRLRRVKMWEKSFLDFMENYTIGDDLNISYSAERSLDDEVSSINKKSTSLTILVAYSATLVYMIFALGEDHSKKEIRVQTKIVISVTGMVLILVSVIASFGIAVSFDYIISPIAIQIVPFLALSVGGGNIFVLINRYQKFFPLSTADVDHKDHLSNVVGLSAPVLAAATVSESLAFYIASIVTDTPAIKTFALCTAISVTINFVLQMTVLISVIELSYRYQDKLSQLSSCLEKKIDEEIANQGVPNNDDVKAGKFYVFMVKYYAPIVTSPVMRYLSVLACAIFTYFSLTFITTIEVGLEGRAVVPSGSYLRQYYEDFDEYSRLGPPVYFVVKSGYNYSSIEGQNRICSQHECQLNSLTAQIQNASFNFNSSKIALSATSWLDDLLTFADIKDDKSCCNTNSTASREFCKVTNSSGTDGKSPSQKSPSGRPINDEMTRYLNYFLGEIPTSECPEGGKFLENTVNINRHGSIGATYFATYHTPLVSSRDYIKAYLKADQLTTNIEKTLNQNIGQAMKSFEVFAYSDFYVYYAQFQNIVLITVKTLAVTFFVMFIVKGILLGLNFVVAPLITLILVLFTIDLLGTMALLGVAFSEVTLVNIIICIGIAGELFTHVAESFSVYTGSDPVSRLTQTSSTLSHTGSSLLAGSLIPKLLTFCGLALLKSDLVRSYFFQIYIGLLGLAAVYSLLIVPVLLSFIGPILEPTPTETRLMALDPNYNVEAPPADSELTPLQPSAGGPSNQPSSGTSQQPSATS